MKSKRVGKPTFFVIFFLILALTYCAFFGIENYYGDTRNVYTKGAKDIRWGIDISGGVEAVYTPAENVENISDADMQAAKELLETRLNNQNITDYEVYCDSSNHQVIVRFPWKAGESEFDPLETANELSATALVVFREGDSEDGKIILQGAEDVKSASPSVDENGNPAVALEFTTQGQKKFASATAENIGSTISIWLQTTTNEVDEDGKVTPVVQNDLLSNAEVQEKIDSGSCQITGKDMTSDYVIELSDKINSGKLPFALTVNESKLQVISPTLGSNALNVMVIAGAIAFGLVCLLMILRYRLQGVITAIALLGQLAGSIACISGFFDGVPSFTLTVPGIAGIILSIGVGVDCNVIAAERIKDEFQKGKTIDGAIDSGFKNSLSAIIDGNVTIVIVSLVLMGAFGTPDSFIAKIFSPLMSLFGSQITGSIYAFGYTLLVGVIFNLIMGVLASKYMLKSISRLKVFRNPWFYGGKKNA